AGRREERRSDGEPHRGGSAEATQGGRWTIDRHGGSPGKLSERRHLRAPCSLFDRTDATVTLNSRSCEGGSQTPIVERTAYSSGKNVSSNARRRNGTPLVPLLPPIVRCTVLRCRNRQSWKFSSMSTSSSQVS